MSQLRSIEIKAFVPARDYALSQRFYADLGFEQKSDSHGVSYFVHGQCSFLLQDFYHPQLAENLVLHLLVDDVDAWHRQWLAQGVAERYPAKIGPLVDQPWGMRDFCLHDPSGVLWRVGQNL
ncbi:MULTISPECIES: VOC family protein [Chromobacterium]|uniref:VOC family protein n=1 Tax=Chromobacterium TaxID=535 RepID=UPI0009DAE2E4|nr:MULTISPECIES: VOC family protein [Chromobacterium]MCP1293165.1 VOC family protein [Chromobacterium sp. S0633]OQS39259.1 glyoxalase [Chromobacterium haemolyticum]PTU64352.1 glyoxalase [Chromobacterium sp. Panama]